MVKFVYLYFFNNLHVYSSYENCISLLLLKLICNKYLLLINEYKIKYSIYFGK
jgi:hypothetical protein